MEPPSNRFRDLPASLATELVDVLVDAPGVKLERIVSLGHATPPGEWYDQEMLRTGVIAWSGPSRPRTPSGWPCAGAEPPACRGAPRDVASYAGDVQ